MNMDLQSYRESLQISPFDIGREKAAKIWGVSPDQARRILFKLRAEADIASNPVVDQSGPVLNSPESIDDKVKAFLRKREYSSNVIDIANGLDVSPARVQSSIESLRLSSINFTILPNGSVKWLDVPPAGGLISIKHSASDYDGGWRKIGACGDQHLGSNYERLDVNEALYDRYAEEGITQVFNTGNWIEGEAGRMNFADVKVHGMDDQIAYAIKHYPARDGITTYFVAGDDHEGWYQKKARITIGAHFERMAKEAGRNDLVYLGYMEADVKLEAEHGEAFMKVMHPGGGSAYATSYAPQKIAESFQEGEKPHICLLGHYHKMDYGFHRGIHMVQTGTSQDQSSFMRKQKIKAHVGGALIEFHQSPYGDINRFKVEFFTFYDRDFYANRRSFETSGRKTPDSVSIPVL